MLSQKYVDKDTRKVGVMLSLVAIFRLESQLGVQGQPIFSTHRKRYV